MKKVFILTISMLLIGYSHMTYAVRVSLLYQATLPVSSQLASERSQLISQGLSQVLIKVSGDAQVMSNKAIQSSMGSAEQLMQEFSYTSASGNDSAKPYWLHMDFDPEGVNRLLRNAGVPVWAQNRPLILVIITYEAQGQQPDIISTESPTPILYWLKQEAELKGLPVIFPVMDVEDMNHLSAQDSINGALTHLTEVEKRYGCDALLIGRVIQDPTKKYITQWKFVQGNDQLDWNRDGNLLQEILQGAVNQVTAKLASHYAVVMTNQAHHKLVLNVSGMTESDDVMQLMDYLKQLTLITDVQLLKVTGSDVMLSISLRGSKQSFMESVSIEKKLTLDETTPDETVLHFQWNH